MFILYRREVAIPLSSSEQSQRTGDSLNMQCKYRKRSPTSKTRGALKSAFIAPRRDQRAINAPRHLSTSSRVCVISQSWFWSFGMRACMRLVYVGTLPFARSQSLIACARVFFMLGEFLSPDPSYPSNPFIHPAWPDPLLHNRILFPRREPHRSPARAVASSLASRDFQ
jgi:hypothetical protein